MGIYGEVELTFYQLTPMGVSRIQNGQIQHLDPAQRGVLTELAQLGGMAEWDELKVRALASPMTLRKSLQRLVDLGYVTVPNLQAQQQQQQQQE